MKLAPFVAFSLLILQLTFVNSDTPNSIFAPGAQIVLEITGLAFAEGPATDGSGSVYFTDQPNDRILRWDPSGKVSVFFSSYGRSNGLCFGSDDDLFACADNHNELWK